MIGEIDLNKPVRNIILGSDWWTDCDDCVALRVLCVAHKRGLIKLLGVCLDACTDYSVESVDAFIKLEGLDDIPVGIDRDATDFHGIPIYQKPFAKKYPVYKQTNENAYDAVKLYRKLLSQAEDKVDIVEIGFNQVLTALLDSEADEYSELNGYELVKSKVGRLWCMAGDFGKLKMPEHNFCNNQRSRTAGKILCERFPAPITFLGWEIGIKVVTGNKLEKGDFLLSIMRFHGSFIGRFSWDPMTALCAVIGDEKEAGYSFETGYVSVNEKTGANSFVRDAQGPHRYLICDKPYSYYADEINEIIKSPKGNSI